MRRSPTYHNYQVTTPYGVHVPVLDERDAECVRAKGRKAATLDKLADKMADNPDWEFWILPFAHGRRRVLARDESHRATIQAAHGSDRVTVWTLAELRERIEWQMAQWTLRILARMGDPVPASAKT